VDNILSHYLILHFRNEGYTQLHQIANMAATTPWFQGWHTMEDMKDWRIGNRQRL